MPCAYEPNCRSHFRMCRPIYYLKKKNAHFPHFMLASNNKAGCNASVIAAVSHTLHVAGVLAVRLPFFHSTQQKNNKLYVAVCVCVCALFLPHIFCCMRSFAVLCIRLHCTQPLIIIIVYYVWCAMLL